MIDDGAYYVIIRDMVNGQLTCILCIHYNSTGFTCVYVSCILYNLLRCCLYHCLQTSINFCYLAHNAYVRSKSVCIGLIDIVDDIIGSFVSSVKVIAFENVHNTVTAPRVITLHTQLFF